MEAPGFWEQGDAAQTAMKELKSLQKDSKDYKELEQAVEDLEGFIELAYEEDDENMLPELKDMLADF